MKQSEWLRFTWPLNSAARESSGLPSHYAMRQAQRKDREVVRKLFDSVFSTDNDFAAYYRELRAPLEEKIKEHFGGRSVNCVLLTHGNRVIGASLLEADADAPSHLLTGPVVLMEYRNRGFGTRLLRESLSFLAEKHELKTARGLTRRNSLAARFVYPKFDGASEQASFADIEEVLAED